MSSVKINEIAVNQDTQDFDADNALYTCDESTEAVVIRNSFDSTQNLYIGWNQKATMANSIPPGTSVVYERVGSTLKGNVLYIGFGGSSGGKGLISVLEQTEIC